MMRRTPLRRGSKGLKRTPLRKMSPQKRTWKKLYLERCRVDGKTVGLDRHHPMGQQGEYILCYILITRVLHDWIHDHGKEARRQGWLLAPFEGSPYNPYEPRAWRPALESHWPERFKRPLAS